MPVPLRRNRDFMLLWSGQVVSALGSRVSSVAFPLLVLALTGSPSKAGIVGFAGTLPLLLFQLPVGGLVDRWDRRRAMILSDVGRAFVVGGLGLAVLAGHAPFWLIAVVAFCEGSLFVVFTLCEEAALPNVVPAEQLPAAIAQNEARSRGAALAGQPLGGLLFGLGQAVPFLTDGLSYLASVVTLAFIRTEFQEERAPGRRALHKEIGEGLAWLWGQPFLRAAALLVAGSNFVFQALVLIAIVLAQDHGASPALVGLMLGLLGAGGLLGAFAAPWVSRRVPARVVVIGANWVWAALLPLFAVLPWPLALGAVGGAMAFVGPAWNVVLGTYVLRLTPDRLLGRVRSVEMLVAWGVIPLGSLAAGYLLQWFGGAGAVAAMSGLMLAIAVAATASPAVRHAPPLPAAPAPADAVD